MDLRGGGAGSDESPADQVGEVRGEVWVDEFRGQGHFCSKGGEEFAGEEKTTQEVVASVEEGIVEEPFPAEAGARFFEIGAHDQVGVGELFREEGEFFCIEERFFGSWREQGPTTRRERGSPLRGERKICAGFLRPRLGPGRGRGARLAKGDRSLEQLGEFF